MDLSTVSTAPLHMGAAGTGGRKSIVAVWDGVKGQPYLKFAQALQQSYMEARRGDMNKGQDTHSGAEISFIEGACLPQSEGQQMVADIREELSHHIDAADLGWYPKEVPNSLILLAQSQHADKAAVAQFIQQRWKQKYEHVAKAAAAAGYILPHPGLLKLAVNSDITVAAYKADRNVFSSAAGQQTAAATPSGAAAAQQQQPQQQTDIQQLAAVLLQLNKSGSSKLQYKVTAKGIPYTPHAAVVEIFWIVMDAIFALAGEEDLQSFWRLMAPGAQGQMQLTQFASHIQLLYDVVQHLGTMTPDADLEVFIGGLNSDSSRQYAERYLEQQRIQGTSVTLMSLAKAVQLYEQSQRIKQTAQKQAQVYTGIDMAGSSSSSGAFGRGAARPPSKTAVANAAAVAAVKLRRDDPKTQAFLAGLSPAKQQMYRAALDLAEQEPSNLNAVCTDCRLSARLHTNAECRSKKAKAEADAVAMAAKAHEQSSSGAAGNSSSSGTTNTSSSSELSMLQGQLTQMAQHLNNLTAMAAFQSAQGMPGAHLRPGQFTGGGGIRPPGGQQQQYQACNLCGYSRGHRKTCWCDDPASAPDDWRGPSKETAEGGVLRYMQRCVSMGIPPKLQRCAATAYKLLQEGKAPAQLKQLILGLQQPAPMFAAAVQYWAPQGVPQMPSAAPYFAIPPAMPGIPAVGAAGAALPALPPPATPQAQSTAAGVGAVVQQGAAAQHGEQQYSYNNPFGSSFAMMALDAGMLPPSQLQVEEVYDEGAVAAAATRSSNKAKGQQQQEESATRKQPMPKSFLPPPQLPADPNSVSVRGSSRAAVTRDVEISLTQADQAAGGSAQSQQQLQGKIEAYRALKDQLEVLISKLTQRLLQESTATAAAADAVWASWQQHGTVESALDVEGTASMAPDYSSSSSSSSRCYGPPEHAAAASVDQLPQELYTRLFFKPEVGSYADRMRAKQTLDRILAHCSEQGITMTLSDGRTCLLEDVIVDSGSNILLITELLCKLLGIHINRTTPVPGLKGIDGKLAGYLVGKSEPFTLTLAKGSPWEAVLPVPMGAYVIRGDAGGMYSMCLDKQTLLPVYGHVNPAYQHLMWYPRAAQGDYSIVHGIPVTSELASTAVMAQQDGICLAPVAQMCAAAAVVDSVSVGTRQPAGVMPGSVGSNNSSSTALPDAPDAASATASSKTWRLQQRQAEADLAWLIGDDDDSSTAVPPQENSSSSTKAQQEQSVCSSGSRILPGFTQIFLGLTMLLLGSCQVFDGVLGGLPSFLCYRLLQAAACGSAGPSPSSDTALSAPAETDGRAAAGESQQQATQVHSRRSRKKRSKERREKAASNRTGTVSLAACLRQLTTAGSALGKLSAKVLLFLMLVVLFSSTSAVAMQTSNSMEAAVAGGALQQQNRFGTMEHNSDRHARALLQHELANLHVSRFAATADASNTSDIKWYQPDPSILQHLTPDGNADDPHDARWTVHPTGQWILGNHPQASPQQMQQLVTLLEQEKGAFAYQLSDVPGYQGGDVSFKLIDPTKRMWSPQRRYTEEELAFGDEKMKEMLDAGVVVEIPTTNPHASAVTLPMKRAADGSWTDKRWCIDLRQTNANTVVDRYGLPLPEDLFRRIRGAKFLVKADFKSGFWQLKLDAESQKHVAFWWRNKLYTYTRLPFGHVNATALFQRVMEKELHAAGIAHCSAPFVDDVILWADTFDEMLLNLRKLLQHLQKVGLRLHPAKTIVAADCLPYLGHLVSADECRPEPAKIAGIQALPRPTTLKQLQAQLGLFNYYRCYVPEFSRIAQPLYQLLQKGASFTWSEAAQQSYDSLKAALCTPGMALRQPVDNLPFHLYVDWSSNGIAAVLNQKAADGTEYMVACASRSLNTAEQNYPAWKGEALAAVWGVKLFRPYLHSKEFFLHTDHRALLWLLTHKTPVGQQMRWILALQEYRFNLVHKAGSSTPADVPSREPSSCMADSTGARLDADLIDWPLPQVLHSDLTPDPTQYTHDSLTHMLGMSRPATGKSMGGSVAAVATAVGHASDSLPPATCLAEQPQQHYSSAQLQHSVLQCLMASNDTAVGAFLPSTASLLGGGVHGLFNSSNGTTDTQHPAVAWRQQDLQRAASAWVASAATHTTAAATTLPGSFAGKPDSLGIRPTQQLNTAACHSTFFPNAGAEGIVLYEPFGGLCAGLEMALRNGFTVRQYIYSDLDPLAQQVARHRIRQLQTMYPHQFPEQAVEGCFSSLPMDIRQVTSHHLQQAMTAAPVKQWLVVAGWPCQDLSTAGSCLGLRGDRSQLLYDLVRVVGMLQQLSPVPPAYLIENVALQLHKQQQISVGDFNTITAMIGHPITVDAAQFGSLAHRTRNYWTNLCDTTKMQSALQFVRRNPGRSTDIALGPNRLAQPVTHYDYPPQYPCNAIGQQRAAWPTLVSRPQSYAFRPGQPGSVLDVSDPAYPRWDEPTAEEREVALGYLPGSTAAEGVSEAQRCKVLGQCIDANSLQVLMATAKAWWHREHTMTDTATMECLLTQQNSTTSQPQRQYVHIYSEAPNGQEPECSNNETLCYSFSCALVAAANLQEEAQRGDQQSVDIWSDQPVMQYLKTGQLPAQLDGKQRGRIQRRAQNYYLQGEMLMRRMPDGSERVVPTPQQRAQIITQQHELCGHYGVRRTAALILTKYWWYGLLADVAHLVSKCEHCSRVQASFTAKPEQLQSIPISSQGFRWHVDTAGPLPKSSRNNTYVMIAVEAFSKFLVAVPMKDKEAETIAYHFLHNVLAQFAAPGQVVTDSGSEFQGGFAQLLQDCLIDHACISVDHPQANGQAEKAVHIVKNALRKMCSAKQKIKDWDLDVAWLALGYRCSPHNSTGFTPYELMYARPPIVPPAVKEVVSAPLDLDDAAAAEKDLLLRKQRLQQACPMALENLAIAQHRDQLRYLKVRAPDYKPRTYRFQQGDFVYVQQLSRNSTLQPRAKPVIYRVLEVRDSGVLLLQGRCGRTVSMHMSHCAPCHLPGIDGSIDPLLIDDVDDIVCDICGTDENEGELLLCDYCNSGFHTYCLQPPQQVPEGCWICPGCSAQGITEQDIEHRQQERERQQQREAQPNLFPSAQTKKRDAAAKELDGRLVHRAFKDPSTGKVRKYWGRLHFTCEDNRPYYFKLVYEDGEVLDATVAGVKHHLKPVDTQLPDGVSIPELQVAAVSLQGLHKHTGQQHVSSRYLLTAAIPVVQVPVVDMQLLQQRVQFSLAQAVCDPITRSTQWQQQLTCGSVPIGVEPVKHGATVVMTAPEAAYVKQAVFAGLQQHPALLLCYIAALAFPTSLHALFTGLRQQQRAVALRGSNGWWLAISQPGMPVDLWLR